MSEGHISASLDKADIIAVWSAGHTHIHIHT